METTRLGGYCYNQGVYFVTICTQGRVYYFGEIPQDEAVMNYTPLGLEVEHIIQDMVHKRKGLRIPVFCVMPNHIHLILDMRACELPKKDSKKYTNLSVTINLFKGMVTRYARQMNIPFAWQTRYWEHIVRDDEYNNIATYITHNVETWQLDSLREMEDGEG